MKGTEASVLVVLSSLAALTRARELHFDDVPVECATICGPIVELSYKCDVDNSFDELRRLKRRKVEAVEQRIPHPKAGGGGGVVRARHHHRRPNQNQADLEATPTLPLDGAATDGGNVQQQQPAQDAQQPPPDASPVFIATLPSAASGEDPQLPTPTSAQVTPSEAAQTSTPSSFSSSSSSSSSPSSAPPPPPPPQQQQPSPPPPQAPTSVLVVPVFAQPTSTVFLTVPAPSSLPPVPQVTVPAPLAPSLPPIQQPSIPPVIVPPPPPPQQQAPPRPPQQQQPPPPAQAPQAPAKSSQQSTTSFSPPPQASMSTLPTTVPVTGEGPGKKEPGQKPPADDKDTAEKNCTCGNKSFDVNLLAGMCQSCIRKSGNRASDMDFIMSQCNFTEATYTPDQDKLAYNIRVVAQRPLLSHSANAMGDAGRIGGGCALAAAAVGFVTGLVLLL